MALTDKSDLFVAVHEEGINTVIRQVMRQRPSLFNYGTALIQAKPELLCAPVEAAPGVGRLMTVLPPIPLFGAPNFAFNYCFQLADVTLEFHPGNRIELPAELDPPLGEQRMAFRARGCGGLGCPSRVDRPLVEAQFDLDGALLERASRAPVPRGGTVPTNDFLTALLASTGILQLQGGLELDVKGLPPGTTPPRPPGGGVLDPGRPTTHVFPTRALSCFCLDLLATGQGSIKGPVGGQTIQVKLDGLEIVDLAPEGLENSLECYLLLVVNQVVLSQVNEAVSNVLFRTIDFGGLASLALSASTAVPANPAIEEDQLKAFIDLGAFALNIPPIVVEGGGEESGGTETTRPRTRSGPFHLTGAVSEDAFVSIFEAVRDKTTFDITIVPRNVLAGFKAGAELRFHLSNGSVEFGANNIVKLDELDIVWEKLELNFAIDLPEICFPPVKICVPGLGCTPQWCIFEGDNDIVFPPLNIPAVFRTEVSADLRPKVSYVTSPEGNRWKVAIIPFGPMDVDIVDVSDTIGDLLDDLIEEAIDALGLPDAVGDILGVIVDLIRAALDVGDDVQEWIKDLVFGSLGVELGIDNLLVKLLVNEFPILELEDPLEVLGGNDPVRLAIEFIGATVDANEITIGADVGA